MMKMSEGLGKFHNPVFVVEGSLGGLERRHSLNEIFPAPVLQAEIRNANLRASNPWRTH